MTDTKIRPFQPEDRATIVAFRNAQAPAHLHETVAEGEQRDLLRPAEEVRLRLCIGTPPTAYLSAADWETSAWRKPGVCSFDLSVAGDERWADFGAALYERALAFARERGLTRLETSARLYRPDEAVASFLAARGFTEINRQVPVLLDLTVFAPAQFETSVPEGIQLLSWSEVGDTDANRRRLYALSEVLNRDVPTRDVLSLHPSFDEFEKDFGRSEWDSNALILAETEAGDWVGFSQIGFQENSHIGWTFMTGVLPEYRGKGLAFALKLRTIDAALARRCPLILTENHEDNAPMRAINKKLGFVPDFPLVSYGKDLSEIIE